MAHRTVLDEKKCNISQNVGSVLILVYLSVCTQMSLTFAYPTYLQAIKCKAPIPITAFSSSVHPSVPL